MTVVEGTAHVAYDTTDPTTQQHPFVLYRDANGFYYLPRGDAGNSLKAGLYDVSGNPLLPNAALLAAGAAVPTTTMVGVENMLSNGATLDPQLNNVQGTLLASAARTAQTTSPAQTNYNARGVILFLNITAITGGPGLGIQAGVQGIDPVSGTAAQMTGTTGLKTATGLYMLGVFPGTVNAGALVASSDPLPRSWQAIVFVSDTTPYTYSLGYSYIV